MARTNVEAFEKSHGITLPEGYRQFVIDIGSGGDYGPPECGLLQPGKMTNNLANLSKPFPFTKEWCWEDEENPDEQLLEKVGHGRLILGDDGCGEYWTLIVTGPQRGQIWNLTGEGILPCAPPRDFLSWFEYWLDGGTDWWAGLEK